MGGASDAEFGSKRSSVLGKKETDYIALHAQKGSKLLVPRGATTQLQLSVEDFGMQDFGIAYECIGGLGSLSFPSNGAPAAAGNAAKPIQPTPQANGKPEPKNRRAAEMQKEPPRRPNELQADLREKALQATKATVSLQIAKEAAESPRQTPSLHSNSKQKSTPGDTVHVQPAKISSSGLAISQKQTARTPTSDRVKALATPSSSKMGKAIDKQRSTSKTPKAALAETSKVADVGPQPWKTSEFSKQPEEVQRQGGDSQAAAPDGPAGILSRPAVSQRTQSPAMVAVPSQPQESGHITQSLPREQQILVQFSTQGKKRSKSPSSESGTKDRQQGSIALASASRAVKSNQTRLHSENHPAQKLPALANGKALLESTSPKQALNMGDLAECCSLLTDVQPMVEGILDLEDQLHEVSYLKSQLDAAMDLFQANQKAQDLARIQLAEAQQAVDEHDSDEDSLDDFNMEQLPPPQSTGAAIEALPPVEEEPQLLLLADQSANIVQVIAAMQEQLQSSEQQRQTEIGQVLLGRVPPAQATTPGSQAIVPIAAEAPTLQSSLPTLPRETDPFQSPSTTLAAQEGVTVTVTDSPRYLKEQLDLEEIPAASEQLGTSASQRPAKRDAAGHRQDAGELQPTPVETRKHTEMQTGIEQQEGQIPVLNLAAQFQVQTADRAEPNAESPSDMPVQSKHLLQHVSAVEVSADVQKKGNMAPSQIREEVQGVPATEPETEVLPDRLGAQGGNKSAKPGTEAAPRKERSKASASQAAHSGVQGNAHSKAAKADIRPQAMQKAAEVSTADKAISIAKARDAPSAEGITQASVAQSAVERPKEKADAQADAPVAPKAARPAVPLLLEELRQRAVAAVKQRKAGIASVSPQSSPARPTLKQPVPMESNAHEARSAQIDRLKSGQSEQPLKEAAKAPSILTEAQQGQRGDASGHPAEEEEQEAAVEGRGTETVQTDNPAPLTDEKSSEEPSHAQEPPSKRPRTEPPVLSEEPLQKTMVDMPRPSPSPRGSQQRSRNRSRSRELHRRRDSSSGSRRSHRKQRDKERRRSYLARKAAERNSSRERRRRSRSQRSSSSDRRRRYRSRRRSPSPEYRRSTRNRRSRSPGSESRKRTKSVAKLQTGRGSSPGSAVKVRPGERISGQSSPAIAVASRTDPIQSVDDPEKTKENSASLLPMPSASKPDIVGAEAIAQKPADAQKSAAPPVKLVPQDVAPVLIRCNKCNIDFETRMQMSLHLLSKSHFDFPGKSTQSGSKVQAAPNQKLRESRKEADDFLATLPLGNEGRAKQAGQPVSASLPQAQQPKESLTKDPSGETVGTNGTGKPVAKPSGALICTSGYTADKPDQSAKADNQAVPQNVLPSSANTAVKHPGKKGMSLELEPLQATASAGQKCSTSPPVSQGTAAVSQKPKSRLRQTMSRGRGRLHRGRSSSNLSEAQPSAKDTVTAVSDNQAPLPLDQSPPPPPQDESALLISAMSSAGLLPQVVGNNASQSFSSLPPPTPEELGPPGFTPAMSASSVSPAGPPGFSGPLPIQQNQSLSQFGALPLPNISTMPSETLPPGAVLPLPPGITLEDLMSAKDAAEEDRLYNVPLPLPKTRKKVKSGTAGGVKLKRTSSKRKSQHLEELPPGSGEQTFSGAAMQAAGRETTAFPSKEHHSAQPPKSAAPKSLTGATMLRPVSAEAAPLTQSETPAETLRSSPAKTLEAGVPTPQGQAKAISPSVTLGHSLQPGSEGLPAAITSPFSATNPGASFTAPASEKASPRSSSARKPGGGSGNNAPTPDAGQPAVAMRTQDEAEGKDTDSDDSLVLDELRPISPKGPGPWLPQAEPSTQEPLSSASSLSKSAANSLSVVSAAARARVQAPGVPSRLGEPKAAKLHNYSWKLQLTPGGAAGVAKERVGVSAAGLGTGPQRNGGQRSYTWQLNPDGGRAQQQATPAVDKKLLGIDVQKVSNGIKSLTWRRNAATSVTPPRSPQRQGSGEQGLEQKPAQQTSTTQASSTSSFAPATASRPPKIPSSGIQQVLHPKSPQDSSAMTELERTVASAGQINPIWQFMPWRCSACCLGFADRPSLLQHLSSHEHCHFSKLIVRFAYGQDPSTLARGSKFQRDCEFLSHTYPFPCFNRQGLEVGTAAGRMPVWQCQACQEALMGPEFFRHQYGRRHLTRVSEELQREGL